MTALHIPSSSRLAGVVTTAELAAAGISRSQLRRLVRQGIVLHLAHGSYAPAELVAAQSGNRAREQAVPIAAALAVTGPDAVASHRSAALLHELDLLGRGKAEVVTLTRPPFGVGSRTGRPGICLHRAALPVAHVVSRYQVPVTSVARTVIDLARTGSFAAGVAVADSALHARKTSMSELKAVLEACGRWPGIQAARQVVAFSDARAESVLESISRVAFRNHGLPPPELQVWVGDETGMIGRADFLWRGRRTVGEADGAIKYADPSRAMAQLQRDQRLREAGFEVVHFTWPEITRAPAQVAASIRVAFQRGTLGHRP